MNYEGVAGLNSLLSIFNSLKRLQRYCFFLRYARKMWKSFLSCNFLGNDIRVDQAIQNRVMSPRWGLHLIRNLRQLVYHYHFFYVIEHSFGIENMVVCSIVFAKMEMAISL